MCLLCVDIARNALTPLEIARNFREVSSEHSGAVIAAATHAGIADEVAIELINLAVQEECPSES